MNGTGALLDSNIFIYISQKKLDFEKLLETDFIMKKYQFKTHKYMIIKPLKN